MIKNINLTGIAYEVDSNIRKYVIKKIGGLDKYLPRHAVKSAAVDVKLTERKKKVHDSEKFEAEVVLVLPGKVINAKGCSSTMSFAIDSVVAKTHSQLRDYKQSSVPHIGRRGILSRFKRSFKREL
ncbi:MAG: ribosome-associated translation inhibitor RaiA [Candidatus Saccharibacteria bacterium]